MRVCKTYTFEAAHRLRNYDGPCASFHGHSYRLEVEVSGPVVSRPGESADQMVLDFAELDKIVDPLVAMLDHTDLSASARPLEVTRPTAEALVEGLAAPIRRALAQLPLGPTQYGARLARLRLWETAKAYAEWRQEDER